MIYTPVREAASSGFNQANPSPGLPQFRAEAGGLGQALR
jgi:hypothetical protein